MGATQENTSAVSALPATRPCLRREGHSSIFCKGAAPEKRPVVRSKSFDDEFRVCLHSGSNAVVPMRRLSLGANNSENNKKQEQATKKHELSSSQHSKRRRSKKSKLSGNSDLSTSNHSKKSKSRSRSELSESQHSKASHQSKSSTKSSTSRSSKRRTKSSSTVPKILSMDQTLAYADSLTAGLQELKTRGTRDELAGSNHSSSSKRSSSSKSRKSSSKKQDSLYYSKFVCKKLVNNFLGELGLENEATTSVNKSKNPLDVIAAMEIVPPEPKNQGKGWSRSRYENAFTM